MLLLQLLKPEIKKFETKKLVEPENLNLYIFWKKGSRTIKQFAEDLGVPPQRIYELLNGKRMPSKSLLEKLGLRIMYQIVPDSPDLKSDAGQISDPPEDE